jgi:CRP/FNR family transcriptional regulator, cyclic AMP receptor protein
MSPALARPIQTPLEYPLADLPGSIIQDYRKGQTIYRQDQRSTSIYLVVEGMVKVSRLADAGREAIVDIYRPGELFGESALLELEPCCEQATALEVVRLMVWSASKIDEIAMSNPRVAMAVSRVLVQRMVQFNERIDSFSWDTIPRRLARALIRFSERFGKPEDKGWVSMPPFTHGLLGEYIGTERAIVTACMNEFRRQGYVRYSRMSLTLDREPLREFLRENAASRRGKARPRAARPLRVVRARYDGGVSSVAANSEAGFCESANSQ